LFRLSGLRVGQLQQLWMTLRNLQHSQGHSPRHVWIETRQRPADHGTKVPELTADKQRLI
jgi:hypothetical protein